MANTSTTLPRRYNGQQTVFWVDILLWRHTYIISDRDEKSRWRNALGSGAQAFFVFFIPWCRRLRRENESHAHVCVWVHCACVWYCWCLVRSDANLAYIRAVHNIMLCQRIMGQRTILLRVHESGVRDVYDNMWVCVGEVERINIVYYNDLRYIASATDRVQPGPNLHHIAANPVNLQAVSLTPRAGIKRTRS